MSYATKYTRSKVEQMNTSINAAAQMIDDEVEADKYKRKMLMDQITQFDANLVEYRKALAEFDIMPEDDPALARQKVTQKSGTRVVAGSASASTDAMILGAIEHQTKYLKDISNATKGFVDADVNGVSEALKEAGISLPTRISSLNSQDTSMPALTRDLEQAATNLSHREKLQLAAQIDRQKAQIDSRFNRGATESMIKDILGFDAEQYSDDAISASYVDVAESYRVVAGLPEASEEKLQELIDVAIRSTRGRGPKAIPFEETSVEFDQLTDDARKVIETRSERDFVVVRNALSNDGLIDDEERANWNRFQEALDIPEEERTTLDQVRSKYGTDALLGRLEQRGYLQRGVAEAKAGRQKATTTLEGMVAPDQSQERLRREAGKIYEPYAVERFPKGLRGPKLRSKEMEPRSPLREALESLGTDEQVMLEAAVQSQDKDFKPTEFTRQVLEQLPKGTDARTARARFQKLADDVESSPEKARRVRSNMMAAWFQRFGDNLSKQAPVKMPEDLG